MGCGTSTIGENEERENSSIKKYNNTNFYRKLKLKSIKTIKKEKGKMKTVITSKILGISDLEISKLEKFSYKQIYGKNNENNANSLKSIFANLNVDLSKTNKKNITKSFLFDNTKKSIMHDTISSDQQNIRQKNEQGSIVVNNIDIVSLLGKIHSTTVKKKNQNISILDNLVIKTLNYSAKRIKTYFQNH